MSVHSVYFKQVKDYLRLVHKLVWLTMLQNQKPSVDSSIAKTSVGNLNEKTLV